MEDALVMNKLPLPKYYDGLEWNTVIKPTRKSIPKYLHDDLPTLKHLYIKEKFKEVGKFNCPKLDYFNHMIKHKSVSVKNPPKKDKKKNHDVSFTELKEQFQYALIIADEKSNIVDSLLEKAKSCTKRQNYSFKQKKNKMNTTGKYFSNTVDLVFRQRKKQFLEGQKVNQEPNFEVVEKRINAIKLLNFEN